MINNFFCDKLKFDSNFMPIIEQSIVFEYIENAHFIFWSADKTKILYSYNFKNIDAEIIKYSKEIFQQMEILFECESIKYKISELDNGLYCVVLLVYTPFSIQESEYVASVVFYTKDKEKAYNLRSYINQDLLLQTVLHIHMVINNYEKLVYIIDSFVETISKKDIYMPQHMINVAELCMKIATELNLEKHENTILYISALIHDIGKLYISDNIIMKPTSLSNVEFDEIKKHSEKGSELIKNTFWGMELLKEVSDIVKYHHENYDGTGYPEGLVGSQIPFLSRIIRVADSVDAMISRRYYKEPMEKNTVIDILKKDYNSKFDSEIANVMIEILKNEKSIEVSNLIKNSNFFPKVTLSFFYKDLSNVVSIIGNLIIEDGSAKFIGHNTNFFREKIDIKQIHKASFSFFYQRQLYEFKVDVDRYFDNYFLLSNLVNMPLDKYFSLNWDSIIYIYKNKTETISANIINLGIETIIIKATDEVSNILIKEFFDIVKCLFVENIEDIKFELLIDIKIIKYYIGEKSTVFICKYKNITNVQKDKILKLLFKKQILLRCAKATK